jgi:uncharacterized protein (DUF488 family)
MTDVLTRQIHTIGYSPHTLDSFMRVLRQYEIAAVADVRSQPSSKYKPEFNRDNLAGALANQGVTYVFLGSECGARPDDAQCYVDGIVDFGVLEKEPDFVKGLQRIQEGAKRYKIALMCAEKDPIACHRMILISRKLSITFGFDVRHILADGTCEENSQAEARLLRLFDLDSGELPGVGRSHEQRLAEAYRRQGRRIAYREHEQSQDLVKAHDG